LRSTKRATAEVHTIESEDDSGAEKIAALMERHHSIYIKVHNTEEDAVDTIFTDQTGHFPKKSSKGNQYIRVLCDIDSNSILVAAMKNRTSGEMIRAYQELIDRLHSAGIKPKRHILGNECLEDFKKMIVKNKPIGPVALLHMDRQTFGSSAHGQTDSHSLIVLLLE
jgi:hypothetical protein